MKLRDYQQEAVDAVFSYWERAPSTPERPASPLVVMPTGSGKSPTLGETVRRLVQEFGARVLVATHRAELITQDVKAIRSIWPQAPVSIYSASLGRKELGTDIVVAGVQSIVRAAARLGRIDVLIVDEAHLVPPTESDQYGKLIAELRKINPDMRIIGYTATPYRLGQGMLTQGDGAMFTSICIDIPIRRLIDAGYLSTVVAGGVSARIDTDNVKVTAGEYNLGQLGLVSDTDKVNAAVADDVKRELDAGRTSAIVFAVNVEHATRLRNELNMRGVSCEVITGETPRERRDDIIGRFKRRELQAISSCEVLTTGFDAPVVDIVAMVRATLSPSLYVQIVGRGTRIAEGKTNCVLLDYGDNVGRHGPIDAVVVRPKKGDGKAPVKCCPQCAAEVPISLLECPHCGYAWPPPEPKTKLKDKASADAVLSWQKEEEPPRKEAVGSVEWRKHYKRVPEGETATPTLRIDYMAPKRGALAYDKRVASEWLCFDHDEGSYARKKAEKWWDDNVGCRQPESVDDAIALLDFGYMAKVTQVTLIKDGKYDRVTHVLQVRNDPGAAEVEDVDQAILNHPDAPASGWADDDDLPF